MALGVVRVRGNLCKFTGGGRGKKGKFTTCKGKKLTGKSAPKTRCTTKKTTKVKHLRDGSSRVVKTCRKVCKRGKRVVSSKPSRRC